MAPSPNRFPGGGLQFLARVFAVAVIGVVDAFIWRTPLPRWVLGVGDESAHLLTAVLMLTAWHALRRTRSPRELIAAALISAVGIDADHIPGELFHSDIISHGTYRPYGHTLLAVAVIIGVAALVPTGRARTIVRGIALGVLLHLLRDLPTGGIPMFWPIVDWTIGYPYPVYAALLLAAAAAPLLANRRRSPVEPPIR